MENTPYMDSISAARSIAHFREDEEGSLEGNQLISAESEGKEEEDAFVFITENYSTFLKMIRLLKPKDQDLLLAYYSLRKTQDQLGPVFGITQTVCSQLLRLAVKVLCCFIIFGGVPTAEQLRPILENAGLEEMYMQPEHKYFDGKTTEKTIEVSMSQIIAKYAACRNFRTIATELRVHRPDIRRTMRYVSDALSTKGATEQAVGAYVHNLIDKANPIDSGDSVRQKNKSGNYMTADPAEVGFFRITITEESDEVLDSVFAPQGSL